MKKPRKQAHISSPTNITSHLVKPQLGNIGLKPEWQDVFDTQTELSPSSCDSGILLPLLRNTKCFMGRKSRAKRERRAQRSAARRALLHLPASSEASERVAYCPACGGITLGMQASGLYEGLIFDFPQTCPNCDQSTEIITWAEWQSREGLVPHGSTFPNELVCPRWPFPFRANCPTRADLFRQIFRDHFDRWCDLRLDDEVPADQRAYAQIEEPPPRSRPRRCGRFSSRRARPAARAGTSTKTST